jgi:hypothetical protein
LVAGVCAACSGVIGLDSFRVGDQDGGGGQDGGGVVDASGAVDVAVADTGGGGTDAGTDAPMSCVDPVKQCFQCTPTTDPEFLTSCGPGTCQPFDRSRILGLLTADGGLPPLPDGG